MVAVAAIWVNAPARTHGQNACGGDGNAAPVAVKTHARKTSAKGNPKRKRICVAPTVPRAAVNSRCIALRAVCAAAAISVKTAQSILSPRMRGLDPRIDGDCLPTRGEGRNRGGEGEGV